MGPSDVDPDIKQGGTTSSEQKSVFGTKISGITLLVWANQMTWLSSLLHPQHFPFCKKHIVQLSASKTKETKYEKYPKILPPLQIGGNTINFVNTAEHEQDKN